MQNSQTRESYSPSNFHSQFFNIPLEQSFYEVQSRESIRHTPYGHGTETKSNKFWTSQYQSANDLKKITQSQVNRIQSLNTEILMIKGYFSNWCEVKEQREGQLTFKSAEIDQLIATIVTKDKIINNLEKEVSMMRSNTCPLQSDQSIVKSLEREIERRKEMQNSLVELNLRLGQQNQELKSIIEDLQRKDKQLERCASNHPIEQQDSKVLKELQKINSDLNYEIQCKNSHVDNLQAQINNLYKDLSQRQNVIIGLENQLAQNSKKMEGYGQLLEKYQTLQSTWNKQIDKLEAESRKLEAIIKEQEKLLTAKNRQERNYLQTINNNRQQMSKMVTNINKVSQTCLQLQKKYNKLRETMMQEQVYKSEIVEQLNRCQEKVFEFIVKIHHSQEEAYRRISQFQINYENDGNNDKLKKSNFLSIVNYLEEIVSQQIITQINLIQSKMSVEVSKIDPVVKEDLVGKFMELKENAKKLCFHEVP